MLCGLVLLVFSIFSGIGDTSRNDRGVLFIVDTSLSMSVEDIVSENNILTSRLSVARDLLTNIVLTRPSALMTFASSAKLQLPLSTDKGVWDEVVSAIEVVRYGSPTDIETAIASAMLVYGKESMDIYVLTDGERTSEGESLTGVIIPENNILHIVGIGTTEGGKIVNNYDGDGRIVYKRYEGQEILSRLDKNYLETLSKKYDASLEYIEKGSDITRIRETISSSARDTQGIWDNPLLLIISAFLILAGMMMTDYKKK